MKLAVADRVASKQTVVFPVGPPGVCPQWAEQVWPPSHPLVAGLAGGGIEEIGRGSYQGIYSGPVLVRSGTKQTHVSPAPELLSDGHS